MPNVTCMFWFVCCCCCAVSSVIAPERAFFPVCSESPLFSHDFTQKNVFSFTSTRFSSVLSSEDLLLSSCFGLLATAIEALSLMSQQNSGFVFRCKIRCFHLHSTKKMFLMICRKIVAFRSVCSELGWVLLDLVRNDVFAPFPPLITLF